MYLRNRLYEITKEITERNNRLNDLRGKITDLTIDEEEEFITNKLEIMNLRREQRKIEARLNK